MLVSSGKAQAKYQVPWDSCLRFFRFRRHGPCMGGVQISNISSVQKSTSDSLPNNHAYSKVGVVSTKNCEIGNCRVTNRIYMLHAYGRFNHDRISITGVKLSIRDCAKVSTDKVNIVTSHRNDFFVLFPSTRWSLPPCHACYSFVNFRPQQ